MIIWPAMAKKGPKKKPKGKIPPPACKALLLCDQTIIEAGSGKVSIIGAFTNFILPTFPGRTSPFTAFVQLADGIGRYEFRSKSTTCVTILCWRDPRSWR